LNQSDVVELQLKESNLQDNPTRGQGNNCTSFPDWHNIDARTRQPDAGFVPKLDFQLARVSHAYRPRTVLPIQGLWATCIIIITSEKASVVITTVVTSVMASYHRVLQVFDRSVDQKSVECD